MTPFLIIGAIGVALALVALVVGDVLDGVLNLDALDSDLFSISSISAFVGAFGFGGVITALVGFPSPNYVAHTIMHHLDDFGGMRFEMGYASAIATLLFLMMIGCNMLVTKILRKIGT